MPQKARVVKVVSGEFHEVHWGKSPHETLMISTYYSKIKLLQAIDQGPHIVGKKTVGMWTL